MGTDAGDITLDMQNGGVFVPPIVDIDALAQSSLGDAVTKLLDYSAQNRSFDVEPAVDSYYEYIAAGEEAKPEAYRKAVDAISTSLNSAIAEQQVKGADISSLAALKAQVEAGDEGYVRYARFNHNAQQTRMADEQQAELVADAEAMLIRVSRQSGDFGIDALHDAYYHGYLTGDGDIKPAVKMALRGIGMALASGEVATGDKATLREMKGRLGLAHTLDVEEGNGYNEQVVLASALDFVPSVKNGEFERWFNLLSKEEFDRMWSNPELKEKIKDRLRAPGGLHEWHLVSRADIFKRWGVTAEEIKEMRTAVEDVRFVNPPGIHGGRGSTKAHNELLEIIDSSNTYSEFKARLQEWAAKRLDRGIEALPPGLRD